MKHYLHTPTLLHLLERGSRHHGRRIVVVACKFKGFLVLHGFSSDIAHRVTEVAGEILAVFVHHRHAFTLLRLIGMRMEQHSVATRHTS
jgi:hypothetical protein